ncbi:MAG: flavodoxin family protein [bacterium]
MKIIGIVASPRGLKGSTGKLMLEVLRSAEQYGASVETIALKGNTVLPCKACNTCHIKGYCPQKDDFESIKSKILTSDALVLASPNYIFNVSAQMKAFMDRCCGIIHCMAFEGKYGASVVTSGGGDEKPIADYMNHFLITTGIRPVGSMWATMGAIYGESFPEEIKKKASNLGRTLVRSWENKITKPKVEGEIDKFRERMKALILYRKNEWAYEYDYWKKHCKLNIGQD